MTLSKRQKGYLNQHVILFSFQYETHSLQMHFKSPCRSVVAPMPKLSELSYTLKLVVVPCRYLPIPSPSFQPIFAISIVPHLFCCRPTYPLPPYPYLLSHISATVLFRRCLHSWPCLPSPLSRIPTTPPLSSSRVSVEFLISLSSIIPCTFPPLFVYILRSNILLALRRSVLHCFIPSAPHYVSNSPL